MHSGDTSSPSPTSAHRKYSISDEDLESRGLSLHRTISGLNLDHLSSLSEAAGSGPRDPEKMKLSLENSDSVIWIEDKASQKPVAFARAICDGVFIATVWDVAVDPCLQRTGLGKAVMERLLQHLFDKGIMEITLLCLPEAVEFYKRLGFAAKDGGGGLRAMVRKTK